MEYNLLLVTLSTDPYQVSLNHVVSGASAVGLYNDPI
jgi:hypothetical protein